MTQPVASSVPQAVLQPIEPPHPLTPDEDAVLDALHFVLPYADLAAETRLDKVRLQAALGALMASDCVEKLEWREEKKEFVPPRETEKPLEACAFLATAKGLRRVYYA